MKKALVFVVIAVVGIGAGLAAGIMITNSKKQVVIDDLQAKMQQSQAASQERVRGYETMVNQLNSNLEIARTEIELLKQTAPVEAPAANTTTASATTEQPDAIAAGTSSDGSARQYTIQNGDSFWSIAQKQLGNGSRFKEILKLNPKLTSKSKLVVGKKINLPAK